MEIYIHLKNNKDIPLFIAREIGMEYAITTEKDIEDIWAAGVIICALIGTIAGGIYGGNRYKHCPSLNILSTGPFERMGTIFIHALGGSVAGGIFGMAWPLVFIVVPIVIPIYLLTG